jgi:glycosyltransferase involved in cell wall biosynthesis
VRIAAVGNGRSVHVTARSAALAARGHALRLVTLGDVLPAPGVEVATRPIPRNPLAAVGAARGFLRDVHEHRPDLLHLHYAGGKLGTMALLTGVRPLVVTVMGGDVLEEQHPGGRTALERRATARILERADLVLVKADALRAPVSAFGVDPARIETVRWGVDPARFRRDPEAGARVRERLGVAAATPVVLSPRLLAPLYNVDLVVEALAQVPGAHLLLTEYGADPAYRARVGARVDELDLRGRVSWLGQVGHADMAELYSAADVVVSVPSSDGLPQSLFEAMACGAPVVLLDLPSYHEVVEHGVTALLVDKSAAAVAGAVRSLLDDAGLREGIRQRALQRVQEVAFLPREAERVERLYERVLAAPRSRPPGLLRDGRLLDALGLFLR